MSKSEKHKTKSKGKSNFQEKIKNKDRVFVLFYATWCPHSQHFLPIFEEYARSNPEECLSVIADEEPDVFDEYDIEYYPTVILFKHGKVHKRLDVEPGGDLDKKQLKELTGKQ